MEIETDVTFLERALVGGKPISSSHEIDPVSIAILTGTVLSLVWVTLAAR